MLSKIIKSFLRKEEGSIAFEVVWSGLFLSFFFAPTAYLYQHSIAGLESTWGLRNAARSQALNANCLGIAVPVGLPVGYRNLTHKNSSTHILCTETEGESILPSNDRFWNKMKTFDSGFSNYTQSFLNPGKVKNVNSDYAWSYGKFGLGGTDNPMYEGLFTLPSLPNLPIKIKNVQSPSGDTWQFEKSPWKDGHDPIFYSSLPTSKSKDLYKKVFPAR